MQSAPQRNKQIALIVAIVVVALFIGGAAGWFARAGEIADLEERVEGAEERLAELDAEEPEFEEPESEEPEEPEAEEPEEPEAEEPESVTERVPADVVSVRTAGGVHYLTLDYIQFLTGSAAAAAATAHGDESPPPNDYYIVNDNPRLREFPIQAGIPVEVVSNDDGTVDPDGHTMGLNDWVARISGTLSDYYTYSFYWVTVTDNVIVGLEQQYLP
jgi:flagellar basal body-associated protein FliL